MIRVNAALKKMMGLDPLLQPFSDEIRLHLNRYNEKRELLGGKRPLTEVANGHLYYGFHRTEKGWIFREWLPGADGAWLTGDFNGWERFSHPLTRGENGDWSLELTGADALKHGQCVKLLVGRQGLCFERIPAYIRRTVMDPRTYKLCGQIWDPEEPFAWSDGKWRTGRRSRELLIYEAHVGMAQEEPGIGSYRQFADETLEWIGKAGYTAIQLMAIQEHPYYASFGYQVTNFFAPSHRFGTPEDLKYLIDRAHSKGIAVIMDVVHSHACPNGGEGLHMQDGTDDQYFLYGERGWHSAWETRCFNYGKNEVLHFLLSNLKYWQDEFHFDGFRFDGVTSMLYENHGLGVAFTGYQQYYSLNTNVDARVYLTLANELIHENDKKAITVAEDMSGMPGMCLPLNSAGLGFDYRLSMGVPDLWIKLIKETPMDRWSVYQLWHELTGGRPGEKAIGYSESHDQAMVGDQTIMFRLAGAEMYTGMNKEYHSPTMDTAMDMHKLIRFITITLASDGYLNFMGNEFGHPEWIDFPREGNGWSYNYARRQWSLVRSDAYKYQWLGNFDRDMIALVRRAALHGAGPARNLWMDDLNKLIVFSRGKYIFAFNMHPSRSCEGAPIPVGELGEGRYRVLFSTDGREYGGQERISRDYVYSTRQTPQGPAFTLYLPCRTAAVLEKLP